MRKDKFHPINRGRWLPQTCQLYGTHEQVAGFCHVRIIGTNLSFEEN